MGRRVIENGCCIALCMNMAAARDVCARHAAMLAAGARPADLRRLCRSGTGCAEILPIGRKPVLCDRHRRFLQMRTQAGSDGKAVPSPEWFEREAPPDMVCPPCGVQMVWHKQTDPRRVLTLQHDRSGRMRLICMSCNVRHASYPGDYFYDKIAAVRASVYGLILGAM